MMPSLPRAESEDTPCDAFHNERNRRQKEIDVAPPLSLTRSLDRFDDEDVMTPHQPSLSLSLSLSLFLSLEVFLREVDW